MPYRLAYTNATKSGTLDVGYPGILDIYGLIPDYGNQDNFRKLEIQTNSGKWLTVAYRDTTGKLVFNVIEGL